MGRARARRGGHGLEGRARLDDSSWPAVAIEITTSPTQVALATRALRLSVTLDGLRMD
jgi:hypothetical protein